jgi:Tol biopolymer transport system component
MCLLLVCTIIAAGKVKPKSAFLRNGEVWTVKEDGSGLRQLTKDGRAKHHPVWSPDGSRIAYHLDFDGSGNSEIIIISAKRGEVLKTLALPARSSAETPNINAILGMEWLNSNRLAYEGHINPSLSEYRVVDLRSSKVIRTELGSCFSWSPDRQKLAVCGWLPHFAASETSREYVQINGRTVYTLPKGRLVDNIASDLSWSPDSSKVAFLERDDTVKRTKLVILGSGERKITVNLTPKNDFTGVFTWLNDNTLVAQGNDGVWAYSYPRRTSVTLPQRSKRLFGQQARSAQARANLAVSLDAKEASWWPN